jgi:hypothetical protein
MFATLAQLPAALDRVYKFGRGTVKPFFAEGTQKKRETEVDSVSRYSMP